MAAKQAQVGERALRRWRTEPRFRAAYRAASRRLLETTVGRLRAAAGEAVDTLRTALQDERTANRIRAATVVLDSALKVEVGELARRIDALERAQESKG